MKIELIAEINDIGREQLLIREIAFSPDGKLLASCGTDSIIRFWDIATRKEVTQISWDKVASFHNDIKSIAFSPNGLLFAACGSNGSLALFQTSNLELIADFALQKKTTISELSVTFSPCGEYFAAVGWNRALRIISINELKVVQQLNFQGWLASVAFHPTKKLLAISGSSLVRLIDFEHAQSYDNSPKKISLDADKLGGNTVMFSSNEKWLAVACDDDALRIYHIDEKKPHLICHGHRGGPATLAWHPQNNLLISGDRSRFIYLWDGANGELLATTNNHHKQVSCLKWRADGEMFASASWDRSIKFWQVV